MTAIAILFERNAGSSEAGLLLAREILVAIRDKFLDRFSLHPEPCTDLKDLITLILQMRDQQGNVHSIGAGLILEPAAKIFNLRADRQGRARQRGLTKLELINEALIAVARAAHFAVDESANLSRIKSVGSVRRVSAA